MVDLALHVDALAGRRLCGSEVLIMTVCYGIVQRTVEVGVVCGDLSKIGISRTAERVREDEVEKNPSRRGETFSFADSGGRERETGKACMARISRRSKAVGEGSAGSRGFRVESVRKAVVKE